MFRYEIFRQSVAGWSFIVSFITFSSSRIDLSVLTDSKWAIVFLAGLLSSPVFGYLVNQVIRAWYIVRKTRPNDIQLKIEDLHRSFVEIVNAENHGGHLNELSALPPKDLHRVLWVSFSNKDLRDRSESYWERYYTNQGIIVSICIGAVSAICVFLLNQYLWEWANLIKLSIITIIVLALLIDNRNYLKISVSIENTWIDALIARLKDDPKSFKDGVFKS